MAKLRFGSYGFGVEGLFVSILVFVESYCYLAFILIFRLGVVRGVGLWSLRI